MKILQILILGLALSGLTACGDYAYGPNALESEQIKNWGGVGKNQPVSVGPSRKVILESKIGEIYIKPSYSKVQAVDDYIDCGNQAHSPLTNPALAWSYKVDVCMLNKGYDFAEPITGLDGSYSGFCGHELFRAKNLEFCRSTSHYQARLKAHLEAKDNPLPDMQIWSTKHSYETKVTDFLDCMKIAYATSATTNLYPFYQTWGECMTQRGHELIDNIEGYEDYPSFCGWKPYFLKHTEFCLSSQDNRFYKANMSLFKDYYELHGLPNPNDTTRPGDSINSLIKDKK